MKATTVQKCQFYWVMRCYISTPGGSRALSNHAKMRYLNTYRCPLMTERAFYGGGSTFSCLSMYNPWRPPRYKKCYFSQGPVALHIISLEIQDTVEPCKEVMPLKILVSCDGLRVYFVDDLLWMFINLLSIQDTRRGLFLMKKRRARAFTGMYKTMQY